MPARTITYKDFKKGIDLSMGDYPDDPTSLRDAENLFLTSGRKIRMRPPVGSLDVDVDPAAQGHVVAGCKNLVIARKGDVIENVGTEADQIVTLYFNTPDYMDGDWQLLAAFPYRNKVIAAIRHDFDGCEFGYQDMLHVLDPENPLNEGPEITKPTYVEDPNCPTSWNADGTRPTHLFGQGPIGVHAPSYYPRLASVAEKLHLNRPDGDVSFAGIARPRVWTEFSVEDYLDFGETWYYQIPDNGSTVFQFIVSDRFDKLDDDRAWAGYVLEYLDADGRWQKFVEVDGEPSVDGTYAIRAIDNRYGNHYNEICLNVRWEGEACTWIRWRAKAGGPAMSVIEGGDYIFAADADDREYDGDNSTTLFPTDVNYDQFVQSWEVRILRDDGGLQEIPLIIGREQHFVITGVDAVVDVWQATTSYTERDSFVIPTAGADDLYFMALNDGDSGGAEPAWPVDPGDTVVDGTITWIARDLTSDRRLARIDFNKYRDFIQPRCNTVDPEDVYTTNIRYDTIRFIPVFQPTIWLNEAEDVLVPADDYVLENDNGYIRVTWTQNLPAEGTVWTLKFAPLDTDTVRAEITTQHFASGTYILEDRVWQFQPISLRGIPASTTVIAGIPHFPLLYGAALGGGGGGGSGGGGEVFDTAGDHPFVVPAGVTTLVVEAWGAGGGGGGALGGQIMISLRTGAGGGGGGGAYVLTPISVIPGETLIVRVGDGGAGGKSSWSTIFDNCNPGGLTAGADGENTLIIRQSDLSVLAEVGGGKGGGHATGTGGLFSEVDGGLGGDGGLPVDPLSGSAGDDGADGDGRVNRIGAWPGCDGRAIGGAGGLSGAPDSQGQGGQGADGQCDGVACVDIDDGEDGSVGRARLLWGAAIQSWYEEVAPSVLPINGWQRYHIALRKRITTDDGSEIVGDETYLYGNAAGRESIFFIEKQAYYQRISGAGEAGFLGSAAQDNTCGNVAALTTIQNRLAVHYEQSTQVWGIFADPAQNFFLDSLHFGAKGPGTEFYGGSMILTQESFRMLNLGGLNYDSLKDNNYGRPIEKIPIDEIYVARYWPFLGCYVACVSIDGEVAFAVFSFSAEAKVAGWSIFRVRDIVEPVVDSMWDVGDRLYFRTGDRIRYFDGSAGEGGWIDDVDLEAYEAALAAAGPDEIVRKQDFKYKARGRLQHDNLGSVSTMKKWLWVDIEQDGRCRFYFYTDPREGAHRVRGPHFDGTTFEQRRKPLALRSVGLSVEVESDDLDGWELNQIVLGVSASRR